MLETTILESMYEELTDTWLHANDTPLDRCDTCGVLSSGILYNVLGVDGRELLVCYNCYILLMRTAWRES